MPDYHLDGAQSRIKISGKSSLHPIHGRGRPGAMSGWLRVGGDGGAPGPGAVVDGHVELPVTAIDFGSALYDRELPKRLDARRHPTVSLDLVRAEAADGSTWRLWLSLVLHGTTLPFEECALVAWPTAGELAMSGSHHFDVRDFGLQPPKMLGMRVHPEFEVSIHVVGHLADASSAKEE